MTVRPTLAYWEVRGLAGGIRCLLTHLEVDFENKMYRIGEDLKGSDWFDTKPTLDMHFPNLPYFWDEDVRISESRSVLRYICQKYRPEYLGRTLLEQAHADQLLNVFGGSFQNTVQILFAENWAERRDETLDLFRAFIEGFMKMHGEFRFAVGNEPTHVDFMLYEYFTNIVKRYDSSFVEGFPKLGEYVENVKQLPHVEEYEAWASPMLPFSRRRPWVRDTIP